jgi:hypothetical protein
MPQDKITIYGLKGDGTYVVEFKTAAGETLAISVPSGDTAVLSISRRACRMDWSCRRRRGRPMMADRAAGIAPGGTDARLRDVNGRVCAESPASAASMQRPMRGHGATPMVDEGLRHTELASSATAQRRQAKESPVIRHPDNARRSRF